MPLKKTAAKKPKVNKAKSKTELEKLGEDKKALTLENDGLRLGIAKIGEENLLLTTTYIETIKALAIRLGGNVYIDTATALAAADPNLKVQQEHDTNGGFRVVLHIEKDADEK